MDVDDWLDNWNNCEISAMSNIEHTVSAGNVYEDLGYEDSAGMKMKAKAVRMLAKTIADSGMTQSDVAKILGIDQPKISRILRGQFRGLSLEKIIGYIMSPGNDVDITVTEKQYSESAGHFHMAVAD